MTPTDHSAAPTLPDPAMAHCVLCGRPAGPKTLRLREMQIGLRDQFDYLCCHECGSIQIARIPANMDRYYPSDYYSFQADPEANPSTLARWLLGMVKLARPMVRFGLLDDGFLGRGCRRFAAWLDLRLLVLESFQRTKVRTDAAILDVGCGAGLIPYCLQQVGFRRVVGLDPYVANERQFRNGLIVLKRDLPSFSAETQEQFDLVTFHHSLEHVANPIEQLRAARRLLTANGIVLVRIPLVDSDAFDEYGVDMADLDAPRHLFVPTRKGLACAARAAGLEIGATFFDSTEAQFWASEQYRRDIPHMSAASHYRNGGNAKFTRLALRAFRRRAIDCNRRGRGATAAFFLRASQSSPAFEVAP